MSRLPGIVLRPDAPAVCLDDRARNREPDAHAVRLGGEERLEQAAKSFWRNAESAVFNRHFDLTLAVALRPHCHLSPFGGYLFDGIHRVKNQVQQHLLQVHRIAHHQWQPR